MPRYRFVCPFCEEEREVTLPADVRDEWTDECTCCGEYIERRPTVPMAVLWDGKFHSPWAKKEEGEW